MRISFFVLLCCLLCFAAGQGLAAELQWKVATHKEGITVFMRKAEGENIAEVKAVGLIQAPPEEVWKILVDLDNYPRHMPYTEVARSLGREEDEKTFYFYTVLNVPFVSRRDYVLKLRDVSEWHEGEGFLKLSWSVAEDADQRVPPRPGLVRLYLNEGHWLLEPREEGKATWVTYYVLTNPGGALPARIVNKANQTAAPDVIMAVRRAVQRR